jgi:hypothetical protein
MFLPPPLHRRFDGTHVHVQHPSMRPAHRFTTPPQSNAQGMVLSRRLSCAALARLPSARSKMREASSGWSSHIALKLSAPCTNTNLRGLAPTAQLKLVIVQCTTPAYVFAALHFIGTFVVAWNPVPLLIPRLHSRLIPTIYRLAALPVNEIPRYPACPPSCIFNHGIFSWVYLLECSDDHLYSFCIRDLLLLP